jgi:hypothetical protein
LTGIALQPWRWARLRTLPRRLLNVIHGWFVRVACDLLTVTHAIGKLRASDRFLMDRITERDVTIRTLVAQVNYNTEVLRRWARSYPVLGKIEAEHLALDKKRLERIKERTAAAAVSANQLPNEPAERPVADSTDVAQIAAEL